jgi:hypothetical protein
MHPEQPSFPGKYSTVISVSEIFFFKRKHWREYQRLP